jgi:dolichyl-phosphate-mannose-protein mannosyltransferase/tetratricopeptide repeat protein
MSQRPPRRKPNPRTTSAAFAWNSGPGLARSEARAWAWVAYGAIGALGVVLLAIALGPHRVGDYFTETDFYGAYADGARLIQHGRLVPARYGVIGPGYELALALVGFLARDLLLAAELLSVASTLATAWLWYDLARRRLDARVGALLVLFLATNAYFLRFGYSATTDAFAIALQSLALWALLARPPGAPARLRALALAGVVAALAFLTRYTAVTLLPAGVIAILAGATGVGSRGRGALAFALGFAAPVLPWVLYSLAHGGGFSLQLHHNIAYEVFARSRGIPWDDYQKKLQSQFPNLAAVIARDPAAVFGRMVANVGEHLRQDATQLLGWPVAVAALAGLVLGWRDGSVRRVWPLLVAGALAFLALVPVFYAERYSLALLPCYALLAAVAFASPLGAMVVAGRWALKPVLAIVPLALAARTSVAHQAHVMNQLPTEVLEVASELRRLERPGDRVIARKGHIGYHAGIEVVGFPFANDLAQLGRYAREAHARWLYFSWPEAETRPALGFLLDTTAVVPGLVPRIVTAPHAAVLYEIGPELGRNPPWFANDTLRAWHDSRAKLLIDAHVPSELERFASLSWALGRLDPARQALELATALSPGNADLYVLQGRVLLELGDYGGAAAAFERAETLAPGNADARVGRGLAALLSGREREAAELWRPVIAQVPSPRIVERMIALYESLGDARAAQEARGRLARLRGGS